MHLSYEKYPKKLILWVILILAILLCSGLSLTHFLLLAGGEGEANLSQQLVFVGGAVFQFSFPLLVVWWYEGRFPTPWKFNVRGMWWGIGFGGVIGGAILSLYFFTVRDTTIFAETPAQLRQKLEEFGIATPLGFALFALFLILIHSFLEEYYWRWFVFGYCKRLSNVYLALILSSLGFMAHHVVSLFVFFPEQVWTAVIPILLFITVGGAYWAWLYHWCESLISPWLSHLLVDAALFVVAYDLFFLKS